jgi:hypothetical protein
MEIWKTITNFENYEVSNLGKIRRKYLKGYKFRKPVNQRGYSTITFSIGYNFKKFQIHRLVAIEFLENLENKSCVNHINGIKDDNRVENLEWVTHSENEKHSFRVLGKKSNGIIKRKIPIDKINDIKNMSKGGISQRAIAKLFNVSQSAIYKVVNNKTYTKWL